MDTFETGLSKFHELTFTALKQHFPKQKPKVVIHRRYKVVIHRRYKVVIHRRYKNFRNDYFRMELENALLKYDFSNIDYDHFLKPSSLLGTSMLQ